MIKHEVEGMSREQFKDFVVKMDALVEYVNFEELPHKKGIRKLCADMMKCLED